MVPGVLAFLGSRGLAGARFEVWVLGFCRGEVRGLGFGFRFVPGAGEGKLLS